MSTIQHSLVGEERRGERRTYGEEGNVEDDKVQGHGEGDGVDEVHVAPRGHREKRLVFRQ